MVLAQEWKRASVAREKLIRLDDLMNLRQMVECLRLLHSTN